jgi:hypothetical protein
MTLPPPRWLVACVFPLLLVGCEQTLPTAPSTDEDNDIHIINIINVGGDDNSKRAPGDPDPGDDGDALNQPPVLLLPPTQTNVPGDAASVTVSASDPDGDVVSIGFDPQTAPRDCSITPLGGNAAQLNCVISSSSPDDSPFTVRVQADDGRGGVTTGFFIWIVNEPPEEL